METLIWTKPEGLALDPPSLVAAPLYVSGKLPVLYLLHGQYGREEDWCSERGQLLGVLSTVKTPPFIIALPFCSNQKRADQLTQKEPPLEVFGQRLEQVSEELTRRFSVDIDRQAVLGISMGGRQAAWSVLQWPGRFQALGILSGKFQDPYLMALRQAVDWPRDLGRELPLYFHYCGEAEQKFFAGNKKACGELGGRLRTHPFGEHTWAYWRPELAKFLKFLGDLWS